MKVSKISKFFSFGAKNKIFWDKKRKFKILGKKGGKTGKKIQKLGKIFFFLFGEKDEKTFCFGSFQCPPPPEGGGATNGDSGSICSEIRNTSLKKHGLCMRSVSYSLQIEHWISVFRVLHLHLVLHHNLLQNQNKRKKKLTNTLPAKPDCRVSSSLKILFFGPQLFVGTIFPPRGGGSLLPCNPFYHLTIIPFFWGG